MAKTKLSENENKNFSKARKLVNTIIKNIGRADIDWTIQVSMNSVRPEKMAYCCQIEAPANGLQPLTWVCGSWEELLEKLELSSKGLDADSVNRAYHESEIQRCKSLIKYHEEALKEPEES